MGSRPSHWLLASLLLFALPSHAYIIDCDSVPPQEGTHENGYYYAASSHFQFYITVPDSTTHLSDFSGVNCETLVIYGPSGPARATFDHDSNDFIQYGGGDFIYVAAGVDFVADGSVEPWYVKNLDSDIGNNTFTFTGPGVLDGIFVMGSGSSVTVSNSNQDEEALVGGAIGLTGGTLSLQGNVDLCVGTVIDGASVANINGFRVENGQVESYTGGGANLTIFGGAKTTNNPNCP